MDARIGQVMRNGNIVHYAVITGNVVFGSQQEIEFSLGLCEKPVAAAPAKKVVFKEYNVKLSFQYPAWDEKEGIMYNCINATSKADAIKQARYLADADGHTQTGKGKYWFSAQEK